ncbi:MAG: DUF6090 family protein [bacterium]
MKKKNRSAEGKSFTGLRKPGTLTTLFIEITTIIIGVMLALLVNDWRESRNREAFMQATLENIANEIRENMVDLQESISQQKSAVEKLRQQLLY